MKSLSKYIFILLVLISCSIEEEATDWENCFDCSKDAWINVFEGRCEYYDVPSNRRTYNLPITIEFEETATDYFTAYIEVPNYYYATISGDWVNNSNISFAGSNSSISCNLYIKDSTLKLSGNSKKFYMKVDSMVVEKLINFDIISK